MSVFSSNKIRRSVLGFAALALAAVSLLTVPALTRPLEAKVFMEMDAVRHGGDYRIFALESPAPIHCLRACQDDAQCQAWTYVKPGNGSPAAMCRLKDTVPFYSKSPCCVSGVTVGTSDPRKPYR